MWKTPEHPDPSLRREPPRQRHMAPATLVTPEEQQQAEGGTAAAMMRTSMAPPSLASAAPPDEGNGDYAREIAESLRFQEEIHSLMREGLLEPPMVPAPVSICLGTVVPAPPPPPPPAAAPSSSSSFTALLGLPPSQAMELLHDPTVPVHHPTASTCTPLPPPPLIAAGLPFPAISPTFPSNAALVERAARYSVFAAAAANVEGSTDSSSLQPSNSAGYCDYGSSLAVKPEPADSDSRSEHNQQLALPSPQPPQRGGKRKESEKNKGKSNGVSGKKSKSGGEDTAADGGGVVGKAAADADDKQQLPYVHVRARRGQATDSHSLAERARREKINARMKLLQELVPGCSKISGTALVLDEIIHHVQCLQRQVELLSMRLAAVNPRIDFTGLDSFLAAEPVRVPGSAVGMDAAAAPALWAEVPVDGVLRRQHHTSQIWQGDTAGPHPQQPSPSMWGGDSAHQQHQIFMHHHHGLIGPGTSLFGYDSTGAVPLHASQLKTEL